MLEIDRLRAENRKLVEAVQMVLHDYCADIPTDDVEKLRAAIEGK